MYCIKCGEALSESSKFCTKCGTKIAAKAESVAEVQPVAPLSSHATPNISPLISAGISAAMLLLCFVPWVTAGGKGYSMLTVFTNLTDLHKYDGFPFLFCSFIMIIGAGLLIAALALTLSKNGTATGFVIASSASVFFNLVLFWFFDAVTRGVTGTVVPFLMLLLAIANIVFAVLAKKK